MMAKVVYYSGHVQGVGFRATTAWIARTHPQVRGWVRNLADGRVELLADGDARAIAAFLADVRQRMADHITAEEIFEREPDHALTGFLISY
ncbi:acylphosphatase [Gemmata sp. G18]|uniref:acylphosphatase n=1 Tax=Gemmata palustris TaxID=2822762 RepID=A0ABS5BL68_9BACT|nr:acylphosphatase [Gemmata palustris]MBP3954446.1 acylphosphatase [Gemmata palustris]